MCPTMCYSPSSRKMNNDTLKKMLHAKSCETKPAHGGRGLRDDKDEDDHHSNNAPATMTASAEDCFINNLAQHAGSTSTPPPVNLRSRAGRALNWRMHLRGSKTAGAAAAAALAALIVKVLIVGMIVRTSSAMQTEKIDVMLMREQEPWGPGPMSRISSMPSTSSADDQDAEDTVSSQHASHNSRSLLFGSWQQPSYDWQTVAAPTIRPPTNISTAISTASADTNTLCEGMWCGSSGFSNTLTFADPADGFSSSLATAGASVESASYDSNSITYGYGR